MHSAFNRPMRIISGEFRRRVLRGPTDAETTRPIPDRVKEALCNLLRGHFEGAVVFDAFAGVGSFGLEALSRGAASCVFVERDRKIGQILRENIATLGVEDRCEVVQGDALGSGALARVTEETHIAFFDPPYALIEDDARREHVLEQVARCAERMDPTGFLALRTPWPLRSDKRGGASAADVADLLRVEGCEGPETHEYGSMALHLYAPATS